MKNNILTIDTTNPEKTAVLLAEYLSTSAFPLRKWQSGSGRIKIIGTSSFQPRRLKSGGCGVKVIAKKVWRAKTHQSEELLPAIDKLLKQSKVKTENLGLIIVNIGPGSFTGTRVGVAIANAFAFTLEIPVIGIKAEDDDIEKIVQNGFKLYCQGKARKGIIARPFYDKKPNITTPKDK